MKESGVMSQTAIIEKAARPFRAYVSRPALTPVKASADARHVAPHFKISGTTIDDADRGGQEASMKYVYGAFALLGLFFGIVIFLTAKSAVQEIEGLIAILIGAVFMVAAEVSEISAAQRPQRMRDLPTATEFNPTQKQWDRFAAALQARPKPPSA